MSTLVNGLSWKQIIQKSIDIWEITLAENAEYDEHIRIADSVIANLEGACPLCEYFKPNATVPKGRCAFCPLGPDCVEYWRWKEATSDEERADAAQAMINKLRSLK